MVDRRVSCNASEAANKTIGIAIRSYIQQKQNHRDWDINLQKIACALNSSVHTSTKCTPYIANFGQTISTDQQNYLADSCGNSDERPNNFIKIRNTILQNLARAYNTSKKRYDLRARPINYEIGDVVWKEVVSQSDAFAGIESKFSPKYIKCVVKKKIGSNTYELEDDKGNIHKKVSCTNIKV